MLTLLNAVENVKDEGPITNLPDKVLAIIFRECMKSFMHDLTDRPLENRCILPPPKTTKNIEHWVELKNYPRHNSLRLSFLPDRRMSTIADEEYYKRIRFEIEVKPHKNGRGKYKHKAVYAGLHDSKIRHLALSSSGFSFDRRLSGAELAGLIAETTRIARMYPRLASLVVMVGTWTPLSTMDREGKLLSQLVEELLLLPVLNVSVAFMPSVRSEWALGRMESIEGLPRNKSVGKVMMAGQKKAWILCGDKASFCWAYEMLE